VAIGHGDKFQIGLYWPDAGETEADAFWIEPTYYGTHAYWSFEGLTWNLVDASRESEGSTAPPAP
jgi:hypothetical protein